MDHTNDMVVIGAGVLGLSCALALVRAGARVTVVEAGTDVASGASATPLGALMPHLPERWTTDKAFQFAALADLDRVADALMQETGIATGYARVGRIMPVRRQGFADKADRAIAQAETLWRARERTFTLAREGADARGARPLLSADAAPLGFVVDDLSARIDAPAYARALAQAFRARGGRIETGFATATWAPMAGHLSAHDGRQVRAGAILVAAGAASFPLLEAWTGWRLGGGVPGLAKVLSGSHETMPMSWDAMPLIYDGGVYLVPRGPGRIAVGATTELEWDGSAPPNPARLTDVISAARAIAPWLHDWTAAAPWAGYRPRAAAKDPLVGLIDHERRIWAATAGYKITLGIAHRLSASLADMVANRPDGTGLPHGFRAEAHIAAADERSNAPLTPAGSPRR